MTATPMPDGLWAYIVSRDGAECLKCQSDGGADPLEVHHLIGKGMGGSLPEDLRWDPQNLATLCLKCHQRATNMVEGYQEWVVTRFGDPRRSLELFWVWFRHTYPKRQGGWTPGDHQQPVAPVATTLTTTDCALFKAYLRQAREGFLDSARLAEKIYHEELWKQEGCETLDEWLADPEIGIEKTKFYRMAQVGRLIRLSGMSDPPVLTERKWTKLLPEVKGLEKGVIEEPKIVAELVAQAIALTNKDFELVLAEKRNARKHPAVEVQIPQDTIGYSPDREIVARVQWVKVGTECHLCLLAIPNALAKIPMTIILR